MISVVTRVFGPNLEVHVLGRDTRRARRIVMHRLSIAFLEAGLDTRQSDDRGVVYVYPITGGGPGRLAELRGQVDEIVSRVMP